MEKKVIGFALCAMLCASFSASAQQPNERTKYVQNVKQFKSFKELKIDNMGDNSKMLMN